MPRVALIVTALALAGCGGQSVSDQIKSAAKAGDQAQRQLNKIYAKQRRETKRYLRIYYGR